MRQAEIAPAHDGESRAPVTSLADMPCDRLSVSSDTPVFNIERMFLDDPTLSSIVVIGIDGEANCVSRGWFFAQLVGPLGHGRSLYVRHPVSRLPQPETLVLPASMSPVDAAHAVAGRPVEHRYDDIVIRFEDGQYATIVVADLFAEVAHTHRYVGLHDPLTGLPNRRMFLQRLRAAVMDAGSERRGLLAVLFVDLDDFKPINDVLGHEAGDIALTTIAERLSRLHTEGATIARFGGDEFGVLIEGAADADEVLDAAEQITNALSGPMRVGDERVTLSASIGVALADGRASAEDLLRNADLAMYAAKRDHKGGYALYEAAMHVRASTRLELRSQLEGALEREEFEIHYQPVVMLDSGIVVGSEALLRWRRPQHGLVSPGQFIPLCERTGMIVHLGSWVLREACARAAKWGREHPDHDPLVLSVNLSPRQLMEPGLVDEVSQILSQTQMTPQNLVLEITENVLIDDLDTVLRRLESLKRLGVLIALDDFGVGFSSLGYLSRLPIDVVKLDRQFVSRLGDPRERKLLRGIVNLAHSLDLMPVAEGVETVEQLEELRSAGCERAQGFYFARPMDGPSYIALLGEANPAPALPLAEQALAA